MNFSQVPPCHERFSSLSFISTYSRKCQRYREKFQVLGYGIPDYSIKKLGSHGPNPVSDTTDVTEDRLSVTFWDYSSPRPYSSPTSKILPRYSSPLPYGPDLGTLEADSNGGDGSGENIEQGGGGGGGGGGNGGEGGGGGEGEGEGKKKLTASQVITLVYASLVAVGGIIGYVKKGSKTSFLASSIVAISLIAVFLLLPTNAVLASSIGLGISLALFLLMAKRYSNSGKLFPAGIVAGVSLVMTGGYFHGIQKSLK